MPIDPSQEPSFESLSAAIMLEFIISNPDYIAGFRRIFKQRIADYKDGLLDATHYVWDITDQADKVLK